MVSVMPLLRQLSALTAWGTALRGWAALRTVEEPPGHTHSREHVWPPSACAKATNDFVALAAVTLRRTTALAASADGQTLASWLQVASS